MVKTSFEVEDSGSGRAVPVPFIKNPLVVGVTELYD